MTKIKNGRMTLLMTLHNSTYYILYINYIQNTNIYKEDTMNSIYQ